MYDQFKDIAHNPPAYNAPVKRDQLQFKQLAVGATFDFVSGNARLDSYCVPCQKISARKYRSLPVINDTHHTMQVGTISVMVYHVNHFDRDGNKV